MERLDTDEMPLSETADGRAIKGGEWSLASRRCTYVAPSIWRVNPSGVLKKLRNTGSKQTFDIQVSTQPSTERLNCLLRS